LSIDLLRVVAGELGPHGTVLVPDPAGRLPGRGAWLHANSSCLALAQRKRAFPRALRVGGTVDEARLIAQIGTQQA
jgi:predicted RNA-binding protein YlxR (DUF448 family)